MPTMAHRIMTTDEAIACLKERVQHIEASDAPLTEDDIKAFRRWKADLEDAAKRLGEVLDDTNGSALTL